MDKLWTYLYILIVASVLGCHGSHLHHDKGRQSEHVGDWPCIYNKPCQCNYNFKQVSCSNAGITEIPKVAIYLGGSWSLDFSNNNITRVPDNAFSNLTIQYVQLNDNQLKDISDTAFEGSESVIFSVDLSNNQLTRLPSVIGKFVKIWELNIANNPLPDYDVDVFKGISISLDTLTMGSPELEVWPEAMRYATKLTTLNVLGLSLRTLPDDAFASQGSLYSLGITSTKLESLPVSLNRLSKMYTMTLTDNTQLTETGLTKEAFSGLTNLGVFKIINSRLRSVPPIFDHLSNLRIFDIESNPISNIDDNILHLNSSKEITFLTLNNTLLTSLPPALSRLPLFELDVTNSKITEIKDTDFQESNSKLSYISLSGNPLTKFSDMAFRHHNFSGIWSIRLDNTELTTIPRCFQTLHQLDRLNFINTKVVCTCANLGWMKNWNRKKTRLFIDGLCYNSKMALQAYVDNEVPKCP